MKILKHIFIFCRRLILGLFILPLSTKATLSDNLISYWKLGKNINVKNKKMKNKIDSYKTIDIPYLRVKIHFMDLSKLKGMPIKSDGYTCIFGEDNNKNLDIGIFLKDIEKTSKRIECMPMIFHEIIHSIQMVCQERFMHMEEEKESAAYLGHYLLESLIFEN